MDRDDQSALDTLTGRRGRPDGIIPGEWSGGGTSRGAHTSAAADIGKAVLAGVLFVAVLLFEAVWAVIGLFIEGSKRR
ncbi:hypothetical protein [Sphingomonas aerophila]|uniref:Uncharacterized protein n=1 Tax=Sphingomonas aerophila TaxID=1344948 RepID=A0A7W9BEN3_9SPHN|nr:hypothetical protein [Sphingomonas aerophila]MBB5715845.1 hypothetical protein [Sphingomonas aerophila]